MFYQLFESTAKANLNKLAVQFKEHTLTYKELLHKVNFLASHLKSEGVAKGDIVPIFLARSELPLLAFLALSKIGAVYLPIAADTPKKLQDILSDNIKVTHLITSKKEMPALEALNISSLPHIITISAALAPAAVVLPKKRKHATHKKKTKKSALMTRSKKEEEKSLSIETSNPIEYVIYSSGTTGKPKGVMLSGDGFKYWQQVMREKIDPNVTNVIANVSLNFDAHIWEWLMAFSFGAKITIADSETSKNPMPLKQFIIDERITDITITPSELRDLAVVSSMKFKELAKAGLKRIYSTGEACTTDIYSLCNDSGIELFNCYGPTETTFGISMQKCNDNNMRSNGAPIAIPTTKLASSEYSAVTLKLLKADGSIASADEKDASGELLVNTPFLARGYTNQDLDKKLKVLNGKVYYQTGDTMHLKDGLLYYTGRTNSSSLVKIAGELVDLNGVEACLRSHPKIVDACVVVPKQSLMTNPILVAYIATHGALPSGAIQKHVNEKLNRSSTPSVIINMDHLPRTSTGKIDRNELSNRKIKEFLTPKNLATQSTALEIKIFELLYQVQPHLKNTHLTPTSQLAYLGIDSSKFSLLQGLINKEFKISFAASDFGKLENATPQQIANTIIKLRVMDKAETYIKLLHQGNKNSPPLFFIPPITGDAMSYNAIALLAKNNQESMDRSIYAIEAPGLTDLYATQTDLKNSAALYIKLMHAKQQACLGTDEHPLYLAGWSAGATIAFEIARQEEQAGRPVAALGLIDQFSPALLDLEEPDVFQKTLTFMMKRIISGQPELKDVALTDDDLNLSQKETQSKLMQVEQLFSRIRERLPENKLSLFLENLRCSIIALVQYSHGQAKEPLFLNSGRKVSLYVSTKSQGLAQNILGGDDIEGHPKLGWTPEHMQGNPPVYQYRGDHFEILENPEEIASTLYNSKGFSTEMTPPGSPLKRNPSDKLILEMLDKQTQEMQEMQKLLFILLSRQNTNASTMPIQGEGKAAPQPASEILGASTRMFKQKNHPNSRALDNSSVIRSAPRPIPTTPIARRFGKV